MKLVNPFLAAVIIFVAATAFTLTVSPTTNATPVDIRSDSEVAIQKDLCAQLCQEQQRREYAGVNSSLALLLLPILLIIVTGVVFVRKIPTIKDRIAITTLGIFSIALLLLPVIIAAVRYSTWD
ncbi:MAG: hypothetical protein EON54_16375 [Alcaligenaceae bacterium]|nr:MAG: hypothetical protein EON54_16375 [Alcaligenaceae bacterium]